MTWRNAPKRPLNRWHASYSRGYRPGLPEATWGLCDPVRRFQGPTAMGDTISSAIFTEQPESGFHEACNGFVHWRGACFVVYIGLPYVYIVMVNKPSPFLWISRLTALLTTC